MLILLTLLLPYSPQAITPFVRPRRIDPRYVLWARLHQYGSSAVTLTSWINIVTGEEGRWEGEHRQHHIHGQRGRATWVTCEDQGPQTVGPAVMQDSKLPITRVSPCPCTPLCVPHGRAAGVVLVRGSAWSNATAVAWQLGVPMIVVAVIVLALELYLSVKYPRPASEVILVAAPSVKGSAKGSEPREVGGWTSLTRTQVSAQCLHTPAARPASEVLSHIGSDPPLTPVVRSGAGGAL